MKRKALILAAVLAATTATAADLPKWIAGSWRLDVRGMQVEEHWTSSVGGLMVGMSKTVPRKGKIQFEFLRITEVDGKFAYLAMPQGRPATAFPVKSATESRIVFENVTHDFPQRIIYWRAGEKLCARIEGTMHGKLEGEEWCYDRMAGR